MNTTTNSSQIHHETIPEEENTDDWDLWDPMNDDYYSSKNTLELDPIEDPECDVTGQMAINKFAGKEICQHYIKYGTCVDDQFCAKLHVSPAVRDRLWTQAKLHGLNKSRVCLNYTYLSPVVLEPDQNKTLLISVTQVKSPSDFSFIAPYEQIDFSHFNDQELEFYIGRVHSTSPYKTKLQKCHEQLSALFDHNYRIDDIDDTIYLSQIVACKLENGQFCRALVVETEDLLNDVLDYKLFLLDYGISVRRPRELIYDIRATCLSEPPLAIHGRLNLKPAAGQTKWPEEALTKFGQQVASEEYILCKILRFEPQDRTFIVDLYDTKTRSSITDKMIASGLGNSCSKLNQAV